LSTSYLTIKKKADVKGTVQYLPSSKSLSNRALIIQALCNGQADISNLSSARDTQLMYQLINSSDAVIDVMDAGTTMRFITAYFVVTNQPKTLTGTPRMCQRPIALLVDALREIGAKITYLENEGFPPHQILSFQQQQKTEVSIPGNVSSQYISALMMIAPRLPFGLTIHLTGDITSRPYLEMTAALMKHFGAHVLWNESSIHIPHGEYKPAPYRVEPDWSAASYWFAMVALADEAELVLPKVNEEALQGDKVIIDIMEQLGVQSSFEGDDLVLRKGQEAAHFEWNFADCPDLAQTVLPVCAAKNIGGTFTGLESLRIKETDRIAALQNELSKIGAMLKEQNGRWVLKPGDISSLSRVEFNTYHDHRMAMGLAPLATRMDVTIYDPSVVNKSYPYFWKDLEQLGFRGFSLPMSNL
jgi:3-phosphoshikimate 1-carboxyvinyltransferase